MKIKKMKKFFVIDKQNIENKNKILLFCKCGNKISYLDENTYFCNICNIQYKRD